MLNLVISNSRLSQTPCYLEHIPILLGFLALFLSVVYYLKLVKIKFQTHLPGRCIRKLWNVLAVTESQVRLTGLDPVNTEGDNLPVFVYFLDQDVLYQIFHANLAILNNWRVWESRVLLYICQFEVEVLWCDPACLISCLNVTQWAKVGFDYTHAVRYCVDAEVFNSILSFSLCVKVGSWQGDYPRLQLK